MFNTKQMLALINPLLDREKCQEVDLELEDIAVENGNLVAKFSTIYATPTDWVIVASPNGLFVRQTSTGKLTRLSYSDSSGYPMLSDKSCELIESLAGQSASLYYVIYRIIMTGAEFDMPENAYGASEAYKEIYPTISTSFSDVNHEGDDLVLAIKDNSQSDVQYVRFNNASSSSILNRQVNDNMEVTVDVIRVTKKVVARRRIKNLQGNKVTLQDHALDKVKLFRINVHDGVVSFARYTNPQNTPNGPKQMLSNAVVHVNLDRVLLSGDPTVDPKTSKILQHTLTSYIRDKYVSEIKDQLDGKLSRAHSNSTKPYMLICSASKLQEIDEEFPDDNAIKEIASSNNRHIIFDNFATIYNPHRCVIKAAPTDDISIGNAAIRYYERGFGDIAIWCLNADSRFIDDEIFIAESGDKSAVKWNNGQGEQMHVTEFVSYRDAYENIIDLIALHGFVSDIKDLVKYVSEDSLRSAKTLRDKYRATVSVKYEVSDKRFPVALVTLHAMLNDAVFNFEVKVIQGRVLECKSLNSNIATRYDLSKRNLYDEGKKYLDDGCPEGVPATIGTYLCTSILGSFASETMGTMNGSRIDSESTQTKSSVLYGFDSETPVGNQLVKIRDAFINTFGVFVGMNGQRTETPVTYTVQTNRGPRKIVKKEVLKSNTGDISDMTAINERNPDGSLNQFISAFSVCDGASGTFKVVQEGDRLISQCNIGRKTKNITLSSDETMLSQEFLKTYLIDWLDINPLAGTLLRAINYPEYAPFITEPVARAFASVGETPQTEEEAEMMEEFEENEPDLRDEEPKYKPTFKEMANPNDKYLDDEEVNDIQFTD